MTIKLLKEVLFDCFLVLCVLNSELNNLTTWAKSSYNNCKLYNCSTLHKHTVQAVIKTCGPLYYSVHVQRYMRHREGPRKKYTRCLKPFIFEKAKPQAQTHEWDHSAVQQCHELVSEMHLRRQTERVGNQETIQPTLKCKQESIQRILCMAMASCTYTRERW